MSAEGNWTSDVKEEFSERTVQELLERAAEFDALAATAKARKAKHALEAFAARFRIPCRVPCR